MAKKSAKEMAEIRNKENLDLLEKEIKTIGKRVAMVLGYMISTPAHFDLIPLNSKTRKFTIRFKGYDLGPGFYEDEMHISMEDIPDQKDVDTADPLNVIQCLGFIDHISILENWVFNSMNFFQEERKRIVKQEALKKIDSVLNDEERKLLGL